MRRDCVTQKQVREGNVATAPFVSLLADDNWLPLCPFITAQVEGHSSLLQGPRPTSTSAVDFYLFGSRLSNVRGGICHFAILYWQINIYYGGRGGVDLPIGGREERRRTSVELEAQRRMSSLQASPPQTGGRSEVYKAGNKKECLSCEVSTFPHLVGLRLR